MKPVPATKTNAQNTRRENKNMIEGNSLIVKKYKQQLYSIEVTLISALTN